MPFTFSHPAFSLPLVKYFPRYFSATGLFFGSIVPDCHMFLTFNIYRIIDNNIYASFILFLPLALILSLFFHSFVRNVIIRHLPSPLDAKYASYLSFNFVKYFKRNYLIVLSSVMFAILIHLILDNFTHSDTLFNREYPTFLISKLTLPLTGEIGIYSLLQLILSALGLIGLVYVFFKGNTSQASFKPVSMAQKASFYGACSLVATSLVLIRMQFPYSPDVFYDIIVISIMSAAMFAVSIVAVLYHFIIKNPA